MQNFEKYGKVLYNEPLKNYTSFKTGGLAKILIFPKAEEDLINVLKICRENNLKHIVLGNCTNILMSDNGFDGVVIMLKGVINDVKIDENEISASAGATLNQVATKASDCGLEGMEFAYGIPGSIGGAVIMNAGAYDGEIKDIVKSVRLLDEELNVLDLTSEEMEFAYRTSIAQKRNYIILSAKFKLSKNEPMKIKTKMSEIMKRRMDKQPLDMPSAGSTFKRPDGYFAAKLIDDAGLRGFTHRGAAVSEKHCGFVINKNNATTTDIIEIMDVIEKVVFDKFNIKLEREVKYIGD